MTDVEKKTIRIVIWRFGLFFFLEILLNTLDRSNVSFAALNMNQNLGFDPKIYGYGVSMFFLTYILFQIPTATVIDRFGSRRVLATSMMIWGVVATLMCLIQTKEQFYGLRLLLGAAEAAAPAALGLYAARWIPERYVASFMVWPNLAFPISVVLGAPLSGLLLSALEGHAGWPGWRWMFLLEGVPTILLGLLSLRWLADSPEKVSWLSDAQRTWLAGETSPRRARDPSKGAGGRALWTTVRDGRLWLFSVISFTLGSSVYGLVFWLPQVIAGLSPGSDPIRAIVLSAVPWMGVAAGMILSSWNSDRVQERHWHLAAGVALGAVGLAVAAAAASPSAGLAGLTLAGFGVGVAQAVMWPVVIGYARGRPTAALSMAFFNLLANVAGVAINSGIGWLRVATGGFSTPMYLLAGLLVAGAGLTLLDAQRHGRRPENLLGAPRSKGLT